LVKLLTMTTLPLGEVKTHLSELVGRVHDHHERVTVTVHGRPSAVLVAVEDLERLEETLAILRDADTMRRPAESDPSSPAARRYPQPDLPKQSGTGRRTSEPGHPRAVHPADHADSATRACRNIA
jgi:antitoxin YefM